MLKVVVTGANGFIGRNLCARLAFTEELHLEKITREDTPESIVSKINGANIIFHLAGENRPSDETAFEIVNVEFSETILKAVSQGPVACKIIITSSLQATANNPYGISKLKAEKIAEKWVSDTRHEVVVYRLPGIFGKWCKPNYNSVVATYCWNVIRDIPIEVRDPSHTLHLSYIDDVVNTFIEEISAPLHPGSFEMHKVEKVHTIKLGELAQLIKDFKEGRNNLSLPLVGLEFNKALYSTYLSYLQEDNFGYPLNLRSDERGHLFEWIKGTGFGQVFVSTTKPGITRGNHFHHTKTEKFLVIQGEATIQFRNIEEDRIIEYSVNGDQPTVLDIPPGYTHNITNVGDIDLITLFWANEIFDAARPDTQFLKV